jgi:hypothetical protein
MKIIFLDNDGVICLPEQWGSRFVKTKRFKEMNPGLDLPVRCKFDNFDEASISVLNSILQKTNAEIVISSDWRINANFDELCDYYESQGIKRPIGKTPNLSDIDKMTYSLYAYKGWLERIRIVEIKEYLKNSNISKWVAVDDLNLSPKFNGGYGIENFVNTTIYGISQPGIKEMIVNYLI